MFSKENSKYAVKKKCDHYLSLFGLSRNGFMMQDSISHHEHHGEWEAVEILKAALSRCNEIDAKKNPA